MIIAIPFSGFYESIHSDNIETHLYNSEFTDHATGCTNNDRLIELAQESINWRALYTDYAKEYVKQFNHEFNLNLVFDELKRPLEYNFTTDQIYCDISPIETHKLFENTKAEFIDKHARAMFTSRSGFISFYNNDWRTWGQVFTWDHNQLYCLLLAWLEADQGITNWYETEAYLMDDYLSSNGGASELLHNHCADKRIFKVSDYLNRRAERV